MSAAHAFFINELKRAAPLALTLVLVPLCALAIRVATVPLWPPPGHDFGWRSWMPGLFTVLGLLAGVAQATFAWGIDRWRGNEGWIYARPLGTGTIFIVRSLAVIGSIGLALVVGFQTLMFVNPLFLPLAWPGEIAVLILAVGLGSFFSSSSSAPLASFAAATLLLIGFIALFRLLIVWVAVPRGSLGWLQISLAHCAFALLAGGGLLAATWLTMRKAPTDASPRKEGLVVAATGTVLATVVAALVLAAPSTTSLRTDAVRLLGQGAELRMVTTVGWLQAGRTHPVIAWPDGREIVVDDLSISRHSAFALPRTGEVLLGNPNDSYRWALLDRSGNQRTFDLSDYVPRWERWGALDPLGWSPDGHAFAWANHERGAPSQLVVLGPERELSAHQLDLPVGTEWRGVWLDGDSLLLAPLTNEFGWEPRKTDVPPWFALVNVDGTVEQPVTYLGDGWWISLPALDNRATAWDPPNHPIPRFGKRPVVWLTGGGFDTLHTLDPSTYDLEPLTVAGDLATGKSGLDAPTLSSLASLPDGSLLWLEDRFPVKTRRLLRVVRLHPTGKFEEPCTIDRADKIEPVAFLGRSGDWVLFEDSLKRSIRACNLDTGQVAALNGIETRRIDFENGELLTPKGRISLADLPPSTDPTQNPRPLESATP